ncbi:hypothetical protein Sm713_63880 [Streptomyces sp. TS71-3]|nr:hypothetical protein Sm713_63880 [Streptomyces sp. TS71-3]
MTGPGTGEGLQLTGEGELLQQLTKRLLESALEGEIADHVGYEKHDPAGKNNGNSRSFGVEIRTVICSTNAIESVNARIRKAVRARRRFRNEAVTKVRG